MGQRLKFKRKNQTPSKYCYMHEKVTHKIMEACLGYRLLADPIRAYTIHGVRLTFAADYVATRLLWSLSEVYSAVLPQQSARQHTFLLSRPWHRRTNRDGKPPLFFPVSALVYWQETTVRSPQRRTTISIHQSCASALARRTFWSPCRRCAPGPCHAHRLNQIATHADARSGSLQLSSGSTRPRRRAHGAVPRARQARAHHGQVRTDRQLIYAMLCYACGGAFSGSAQMTARRFDRCCRTLLDPNGREGN